MYSISGRLDGRWEIFKSETAHKAVEIVDRMHERGVLPVHIKKNGIRIETSQELDDLLRKEAMNASL